MSGKIVEQRWDERGPCDGPRDCVGTARGCSVCDPRPSPTARAVIQQLKTALDHLDLSAISLEDESPEIGYMGRPMRQWSVLLAALTAASTWLDEHPEEA